MEEVLKTLEELQQLSGNSQILQLQYRKSDLLKQVLLYTYDPHKKYKIDEGKYNKFTGIVPRNNYKLTIEDWEQFCLQLERLAEMKSAKDQDVYDIKEFIYNFNDEGRIFLERVLFKDLRLNMNTKKFQKVWPDFLVEPQVQLAEKLENRKIFQNPVYSRKFDGKRVWWDNFVPMSRTNKECSKAPVQHIIDELKCCPEEIKNYILDGELL